MFGLLFFWLVGWWWVSEFGYLICSPHWGAFLAGRSYALIHLDIPHAQLRARVKTNIWLNWIEIGNENNIMENWKKGKQVLMLWKSITGQSSRPCFPNTDYRTGTEAGRSSSGDSKSLDICWASHLINLCLALLTISSFRSQRKHQGRGLLGTKSWQQGNTS